jgi:signal transduction histidine kinase
MVRNGSIRQEVYLLDGEGQSAQNRAMTRRRPVYLVLAIAGGAAGVAVLVLRLLVPSLPPAAPVLQYELVVLLGMAPYYVAGAVSWWRRPEHPLARLLLVSGSAMLLGELAAMTAAAAYWVGGSGALFMSFSSAEQVLSGFSFGLLGSILALFPDGIPRRRYERPLAIALAAIGFLDPILVMLGHATVTVNSYLVWPAPVAVQDVSVVTAIPNPLYLAQLQPLTAIESVIPPSFPLPLVLIGALALLGRYRALDAVRRRQARWPLYAALVLTIGNLASLALPPALSNAGFLVSFPLLPLSLLVALVRDRLFDVDLVVRRSLVYGVLWLLIAAGYAGVAALLGISAGQRFSVTAAVILTIVATLVFQPLRSRLERLADRVAYGHRLDGYELIARLGRALEDTASDVGAEVAETVRRGLDLRWARVSIWLRTGAADWQIEPVGAAGIGLDEPGRAELVVALAHGGEPVGVLECGDRLDGSINERERELLDTLGRQAALALRNFRLTAELRRQSHELEESRSRILRAADDERRRLGRDIHDGVQQELVALMARLRSARNLVPNQPARADEALAEVQEDARRALEQIREIAAGLHPAILGDRGLLEAVEARVSRAPLAVEIDAAPSLRGARFPEAIEGAAYFAVSEGIANVLKHSRASSARVLLAASDRSLLVAVEDDGSGFDASRARGSGLSGLRDRLAAVGGTLDLTTSPGRGTRLSASFPLANGRSGG